MNLGFRTVIVGVVNVTPDSFSDGGRNFDPATAVERALQLEREGAGIVEVGGESTRPGSERVSAKEELKRIVPVLEGLAGRLSVPVSVDTYKSQVAEAAIELGASLINDVSALRFDVRIAEIVAAAGAALVLMHMRGEPSTMQRVEPSTDILAEIESDLSAAVALAETRGVARDQLVIDPGVGFGKTPEQNLSIINNLHRFEPLRLPLMIGTSRKAFIGKLTGAPEAERIFGTAATIALAIARGAHIARVHDVKQMVEVARVCDAILSESALGQPSC
jgi:dihydropteroate synthase